MASGEFEHRPERVDPGLARAEAEANIATLEELNQYPDGMVSFCVSDYQGASLLDRILNKLDGEERYILHVGGREAKITSPFRKGHYLPSAGYFVQTVHGIDSQEGVYDQANPTTLIMPASVFITRRGAVYHAPTERVGQVTPRVGPAYIRNTDKRYGMRLPAHYRNINRAPDHLQHPLGVAMSGLLSVYRAKYGER